MITKLKIAGSILVFLGVLFQYPELSDLGAMPIKSAILFWFVTNMATMIIAFVAWIIFKIQQNHAEMVFWGDSCWNALGLTISAAGLYMYAVPAHQTDGILQINSLWFLGYHVLLTLYFIWRSEI